GGFTATLLENGKVLVTGGHNQLDAYLQSAELFDSDSNTWSAVADMKVRMDHHTATLLPSGKVLITGGETQPLDMGSAWPYPEIYDPTSNEWTLLPSIMGGDASWEFARSHHTATALRNGKVLVVGGEKLYFGLLHNTAELY